MIDISQIDQQIDSLFPAQQDIMPGAPNYPGGPPTGANPSGTSGINTDQLAAGQTGTSTTDPGASGGPAAGSEADQMVSQLKAQGLAPAALQFWEHEETGAAERGSGDPFAGFHLPMADAGDFMELASKADKFESFSGYRYYPTPVQLQYMAEHGMNQMDDQTLYSWMAQQAGVAQSMPWAAGGMTHTDYNDKLASLNDAVMAATGASDWAAAGFSQDDLTKAVRQGWSQSQINSYIQRNQGLTQKYGWAAHGMSYENWQQWKASNRAKVQSHFGAGATDQQFLSEYTNPSQAFNSSGTSIKVGAGNTPTPAATQTGFQSEIR